MPRVPEANAFTVAPAAGGAPRLRSPELSRIGGRSPIDAAQITTPRPIKTPQFDTAVYEPRARAAVDERAAAGARQASALGQALMTAADAEGRIALDVQDQINTTAVEQAVNQLQEARLKLTYDKESGYTTQTGYAALKRDDGKSLSQAYGEQLDAQRDLIAGSLGNDAQRRAFMLRAGQMRVEFDGQTSRWTSDQAKAWTASVHKATIDTSLQTAVASYTDPTQLAPAIERMDRAVAASGQAEGLSAAQIEVNQGVMRSRFHAAVVAAALQNDNVTYADAYFKQYGSQIVDPDTKLKVIGMISGEVDNMQALAAANDALAGGAQFETPEFDRYLNVLVDAGERSPGDYAADGKPLTSPKGAKYKMQVTPETARKPGFGIEPAKNDSPAEYNRVGRQLAYALIQKYDGDYLKASAAYNAGRKWVDAAVARAAKGTPGTNGASWRWQLANDGRSLESRQETDAYIVRVGNAMRSGLGTNPPPTKEALYAQLDKDPRLANNPTRLAAARAQVDRGFEARKQAWESAKDQSNADAMRELEANGGNFEALPIALRAKLDPKQIMELRGFASAVVKGGVVTDDPDAYAKLSDPAYLHNLSDAQMAQFKAVLSPQSFANFDKIRRTPLEFDSAGFKAIVDNRLNSMGIDPSPNTKTAKGKEDLTRGVAINRYLRESVLAQQEALGRKITGKELQDFVDLKFRESYQYNMIEMITGIKMGEKTVNALSMLPRDIPTESRESIKQALKAQGVANPTDAQLLVAYWRSKDRGKQPPRK